MTPPLNPMKQLTGSHQHWGLESSAENRDGRGTQTGTEAKSKQQWSQALLVLKLVPETGAGGLGDSPRSRPK